MPIFPQVDMVPWGLNEMFVTYFVKIPQESFETAPFTLSKTPPQMYLF